ncbi:heavy-metal-associated domain-containing protein [Tenacibaculum finnmarkense]|uniref:cation transporter n=1 Tax=Tenacibaculum finnmarkense TaxID=2781243 RepID=UPI00187B3809|nr:heavy metal-associated domain-containing protein [Tenacibaculum finnmarkense]MBE7692161.1 heavy-metal-associated domain-containing protein [Tenacibaculum finnmarkense genomovar finnmarkense]MCG8805191.1 heavy-metal-associated domain-containing protein [Tenacibaculum finnmarkense]MCG8855380.1 heavy-metal-associated domain-containing protein [Tenacibaculum finnmarkense]
MKIQKIIFALALVSFLVVGCKNEAKKENTPKVEKTTVIADKKEISLNISGMTCEIGCAKKIASDLSKKEGVLEANVIFKDSVANVKYDANITNKADLIAFVEGVGNGKLYKASETSKKSCSAKKACTHAKKDGKICDAACKKACAAACKKSCDSKVKGDKKACAAACEKACCAKSDADKKACATNCEKACCAKNDAQKKA